MARRVIVGGPSTTLELMAAIFIPNEDGDHRKVTFTMGWGAKVTTTIVGAERLPEGAEDDWLLKGEVQEETHDGVIKKGATWKGTYNVKKGSGILDEANPESDD